MYYAAYPMFERNFGQHVRNRARIRHVTLPIGNPGIWGIDERFYELGRILAPSEQENASRAHFHQFLRTMRPDSFRSSGHYVCRTGIECDGVVSDERSADEFRSVTAPIPYGYLSVERTRSHLPDGKIQSGFRPYVQIHETNAVVRIFQGENLFEAVEGGPDDIGRNVVRNYRLRIFGNDDDFRGRSGVFRRFYPLPDRFQIGGNGIPNIRSVIFTNMDDQRLRRIELGFDSGNEREWNRPRRTDGRKRASLPNDPNAFDSFVDGTEKPFVTDPMDFLIQRVTRYGNLLVGATEILSMSIPIDVRSCCVRGSDRSEETRQSVP